MARGAKFKSAVIYLVTIGGYEAERPESAWRNKRRAEKWRDSLAAAKLDTYSDDLGENIRYVVIRETHLYEETGI